MRYVMIILFVSALLSCTNDNLAPSVAELKGQWVEVSTKTDTLAFGLPGSDQLMVLERGQEMVNGFLLPKANSGPYHYKLLNGDKISLLWMLSSSSFSNDYYFKKNGTRLVIGNFYGSSSGAVLTFEKVE